MNIYDVSRKAGVSIATVSRVLNESPNVSDKTKAKVLAVIEETSYTPNVFARGLGLNTMNTIGIMCADSSDNYMGNAIYFLERELRQNNYDSILCFTGYDYENKKKSLELLFAKRVDGIILVGSNFVESTSKKNDYIKNMAKEVPIMLINGYLPYNNIFSTVCDDYQAVFDVTTLLINSNRKYILYLYSSDTYSSQKKLLGYKEALSNMEQPIRNEYIHQCDNDILSAKHILNSLKNQGLEFDAIIASDDILAIGGIKYAKEQNLSIPDDLNVVGYNNSILTRCCDPELTSIDNKVETLCMNTVSTLMRVLQGSNVSTKTTIAADIVRRETTNF